ncbi:MAG: ATP-binding protein [Acidimicrobiales bacterium]
MAVAPLLVLATVAAGLLIFINSSDTRPYGLFAVAGLAVAGFISFAAGRSIIASLNGLTVAAAEMADAHRNMSFDEATMPKPIETVGGDEITKLAAAINGINAAVIDADRSHHDEVRQGLRSIVTNLARRSQTLLDRQVEYLDRLETSEQDPDRLGELFKVDHLATRMRRNAESLIVLAEADPGRRRGGPVDVADVLRVAMGEVEIYQQIELLTVDDGHVNAGIAVDLAHLAAELMENATQFSPPDAGVKVTGRFDGEGSFVITVVDQGMGMTDEKLAATNQLLANPPELGLGMSRSLGFMVIGRLAQRLNATVTISRNDSGAGLSAVVAVPAELFIPANSVGSNGSDPRTPQLAADASAAATATAEPAIAAVIPTGETALPEANGIASVDTAMDPRDHVEAASNALLPPVDGIVPMPDAASPTPDAVASTPDATSPAPYAAVPAPDGLLPTAEALASTVSSPEPDVGKPDVGKADGDTAEMLTPLAPPSAVGDDQPPLDETSAEPPESEALSRLLGTAEKEPNATEPYDWGVGPLGDGQNSDEPDPLGPAPIVPLTRSTEVTTGANPPPADEWVPPDVTPAGPSKLSDAMPSGDAFESGVASLLGEHPSGPTAHPDSRLPGDDATAAGLIKRNRGASDVPIGQGRPVAASKRDPEEVRSRLSRYREGLSGRKPKPIGRSTRPGQPNPDQGAADQGESNQTKSEGR